MSRVTSHQYITRISPLAWNLFKESMIIHTFITFKTTNSCVFIFLVFIVEVQSPTKFLHKGLGIRRTILTKKHRTDQFSPINLTVFLLRPFKPNIDFYVRNKQHSFLPEPFKQRLSFLRPFWLHELRTSPCLFGKSSIHPQSFSHYHLGHTINAMFFSPTK